MVLSMWFKKRFAVILAVLIAMASASADSARAQWVPTNGPYGDYVFALAVIGTNLFAGTGGSGLYYSTGNGPSWTAANIGLTNGDNVVRALAVSGTSLFAGTYGGADLYLSTDSGTSWAAASTGLDGTEV